MNRVFVDASVLFAATYSRTGSARDLIRLALEGKVTLAISPMVLEEAERNLSQKAPAKVEFYKLLIEIVPFELVADLTKEELLEAASYTHLKDAPVVAAARKAQAEYLVTYDRKHLIDPPEVAEKSGLTIVTPDVVVQAIRESDDNPSEPSSN
jgi:putative PIN family toxin of toxin-antitoxin system